jgi:antitoxin VapB
MGSLYIKDEETAALVRRVAERSGLTNTALVRELAEAREAELDRQNAARKSTREILIEFRKRYPLPEKLGPIADKAFYDELSGDDDL